VTGDLTVKGVTKPVTFDVEFGGTATDPFGNHRLGLEGRATINRKDWGVSWNAPLEAGGLLVGEKVTLEFEVSAIKTDS
jgi:polyisoprenoid-binding protein YceI